MIKHTVGLTPTSVFFSMLAAREKPQMAARITRCFMMLKLSGTERPLFISNVLVTNCYTTAGVIKIKYLFGRYYDQKGVLFKALLCFTDNGYLDIKL